MSSYYIIVGNIERIGDHAMNILGYAKNLNEWGIHLSQEALEEVRQMKKICEESAGRYQYAQWKQKGIS